MAGTFHERIEALSEEVGHGDLVGHVVVDQIYHRPGAEHIFNMKVWT